MKTLTVGGKTYELEVDGDYLNGVFAPNEIQYVEEALRAEGYVIVSRVFRDYKSDRVTFKKNWN